MATEKNAEREVTQTGATPLQIGKREIRPEQVHIAVDGLVAELPAGQLQEWMRSLLLRLVRELDADQAEVTGTLRSIFAPELSAALGDAPPSEVKLRSRTLIKNIQSALSKLRSLHMPAGTTRFPLWTIIRTRITRGAGSRAPEIELWILRPGSGSKRQQTYTVRLVARWVFLYGLDYAGQSPRDEIHDHAAWSDILDPLLLALGRIGRAAIARAHAEDVVEGRGSSNAVKSGLKIEILRRFLLLLTPRMEPYELRFFITSLFDLRMRDDLPLDELLSYNFTPNLLAALVADDGELLTGELDEIRWRLVHAEHLDLLDRMLIFKMCQRDSPTDRARYRFQLLLSPTSFRFDLSEQQKRTLGLGDDSVNAKGLTELLEDKLGDVSIAILEVMQTAEREIAFAGGPAAWLRDQWTVRLPM